MLRGVNVRRAPKRVQHDLQLSLPRNDLEQLAKQGVGDGRESFRALEALE